MRKCLNLVVKLLAVVLIIVFLLELSFRYYILDFYQPELMALNSLSSSPDDEWPNVLFFGDSFTANADSYVGKLRIELQANLINSAVPGTGVIEASFMAPSRIKEYTPDILVCQVYLGNDLLDIKHRTTDDIPFLRAVYHSVSDYLRVVKFVNYRLAHARLNYHNTLHSPIAQTDMAFSPELYSARQRMLFQAEPKHLENVLELKNGRDEDLKTMIHRITQIKSLVSENTEVALLLIPHCAQVNQTYFQRMGLLGSESKQVTNPGIYTALVSEFPDVDILDVRSLFQSQISAGQGLYYENDPHLNNKGQSVLAEFMMNYLQAKIQASKD